MPEACYLLSQSGYSLFLDCPVATTSVSPHISRSSRRQDEVRYPLFYHRFPQTPLSLEASDRARNKASAPRFPRTKFDACPPYDGLLAAPHCSRDPTDSTSLPLPLFPSSICQREISPRDPLFSLYILPASLRWTDRAEGPSGVGESGP